MRAPIDSPTFTTLARAPTPATSDSSTKIATTQLVDNKIAAADHLVFSDAFTRADSVLSTFGSVTYLAGVSPLPHIVSDQLKAVASPTSSSQGTALVETSHLSQIIEFDVVSLGAFTDGFSYINAYLRTVATQEATNVYLCQLAKNISTGTVGMSIIRIVGGTSTTLVTASSLTGTPTHVRAMISSNGVITFTATGISTPTITATDTILTGTQVGFSVVATNVLDNLSIVAS